VPRRWSGRRRRGIQPDRGERRWTSELTRWPPRFRCRNGSSCYRGSRWRGRSKCERMLALPCQRRRTFRPLPERHSRSWVPA
jgi:hypothetical protein